MGALADFAIDDLLERVDALGRVRRVGNVHEMHAGEWDVSLRCEKRLIGQVHGAGEGRTWAVCWARGLRMNCSICGAGDCREGCRGGREEVRDTIKLSSSKFCGAFSRTPETLTASSRAVQSPCLQRLHNRATMYTVSSTSPTPSHPNIAPSTHQTEVSARSHGALPNDSHSPRDLVL